MIIPEHFVIGESLNHPLVMQCRWCGMWCDYMLLSCNIMHSKFDITNPDIMQKLKNTLTINIVGEIYLYNKFSDITNLFCSNMQLCYNEI